jgi:hypothetical protein
MDQTIELYIDELVLHGFSPHQRYDIAGAVESELRRLLIEQGIPSSLKTGINAPLLNAGTFNMNKDSKVETIGHEIAGSVYKSFGK